MRTFTLMLCLLPDHLKMMALGVIKRKRIMPKMNMVSLIPIEDDTVDCPLLGLASDSRLTVSEFRAMTHDELEMGT